MASKPAEPVFTEGALSNLKVACSRVAAFEIILAHLLAKSEKFPDLDQACEDLVRGNQLDSQDTKREMALAIHEEANQTIRALFSQAQHLRSRS